MSKDLLVLADEYAAATATFARALALKDGADSMSPIAREAGDKRAVLAEALAALDTAQPVQVNALLVELLTPALPDIQDAVTCLNMWARGECLYAPKNGYEDPETRKATIKDVMRSANTLAPRLLTASRAIQDALVHCTAAKQAQPARPINCGTGHCSCIECPYGQAQPERAPLSDAEIKELLPYSWPWGIEFARAIEAAHGIKQGGQHD